MWFRVTASFTIVVAFLSSWTTFHHVNSPSTLNSSLSTMFLRFRRQLKSRKPASGTGFLRNRLTSVKIKPAVRLTEDALMLGLEALKESSDVFPPLKSVVGGLVYFLDLSKVRVKGTSTVLSTFSAQVLISDSLENEREQVCDK
ncbi:hypothetical protein OF83DRAFT_592845 [Amylostereum chailletii]|nr:hypothetical protein OF83DRAFT_592845 [Amylostereum chailletii]